MIGWKYVIIERPEYPGLEFPVLLPASGLTHAVVASMGTVLSAGFCTITADAVWVWGASASLELGSRGERDARVIRTCFCLRRGGWPSGPVSVCGTDEAVAAGADFLPKETP